MYLGGVLNKFFDTGDAVVYVRADCIGVPTGWNTGGWKNGGGIEGTPAPADAALVAIGWELIYAATDAAAQLATAADDSDWE